MGNILCCVELPEIGAGNHGVTGQTIAGTKILPLFTIKELLKEISIKFIRPCLHSRRSVNTTLHVVLDPDTQFLRGWHIRESGHTLTCELNEGFGATGLIKRHLL